MLFVSIFGDGIRFHVLYWGFGTNTWLWIDMSDSDSEQSTMDTNSSRVKIAQ